MDFLSICKGAFSIASVAAFVILYYNEKLGVIGRLIWLSE